MATKPAWEFTAREALLAYGYNRDEATGLYIHRSPVRTNAWRYAEDRKGWERFDPIENAMPIIAPADFEGDILPWGSAARVEYEQLPGYVQVPFAQLPRFANVGGLHPATHAECFEWIWPEERVKEIYAYVNTEDREWERDEQGALRAVSRK